MYGSVRNFVFEAVWGFIAHRRNEAIRIRNGELIHRALPIRHRLLSGKFHLLRSSLVSEH